MCRSETESMLGKTCRKKKQKKTGVQKKIQLLEFSFEEWVIYIIFKKIILNWSNIVHVLLILKKNVIIYVSNDIYYISREEINGDD